MRAFGHRTKGAVLALIALILAIGMVGCGSPAAEPPGPGEPRDPVDTGPRDLAAYFEGQTIIVLTGSAPGGGYDHTMRAMALHMPDFFEQVHGIRIQAVSQNLPGGQQLRSLQHMFSEVEPDGFKIALLQPRFVLQALTGEPTPGWNLNELRVIGVPMDNNRSALVCMDPNLTGATTYEELVDRGITVRVGEGAPGGTNSMAHQLVEMLGGPIQNVFGYATSAEHIAAFDRGETTGTNRCTSWSTPLDTPWWIDEGRLAPLFWSITPEEPAYLQQLAQGSGGTAEPHHVFDLPGLNPSQAHRDAFDTAQGINTLSRSIYVPPGTPDDIVAFLQEALYVMWDSPEYQETLAAGGVTPGWMPEEEAQQILEVGIRMDAEGIAILEQLVAQ